MKLRSAKSRPVHLGPFPLEALQRTQADAPYVGPKHRPPATPSFAPLAAAMSEYQAMMDAIRDGLVNRTVADCPQNPQERANHLKAFGYFSDADQVGCGRVPKAALLDMPLRNPGIDHLAQTLRTQQTATLASGIDLIMADLRDAMDAPPSTIAGHDHCIVFLYEHPRPLRPQEPGAEWLDSAHEARAALRATETAVVIAQYLRLLGHDAKAHTATSTDVCLPTLAHAAGLIDAKGRAAFARHGYGLAAVTTTFEISHDAPLATVKSPLAWWTGAQARSALNLHPFAKRDFAAGPHPFETLKRQDTPTTYMDEPAIPRVPKRTDMFARAQFGDMGKALQAEATGGKYVRKSAPSAAQRRMLGAFTLLQSGPVAAQPGGSKTTRDAQANTDAIKALGYFLGVDAIGTSRCPDWAWYSHNALGEPITPPHDQAISMIVDQGFESMEGASGDDWISVAQSMRAYLRFSLLGGVVAATIRGLGYEAKSHTVIDGDVLQPPLLLLSGLGEVSRIGEVILNPFLGPRLKSGVVTTTMPLAHDKPIDFGLQSFCEACNKCARECPSGAITAGPKLMFNGYEIWKSDSQKCATYRITTEGGAMCGRCMKTCPWNLEGLFAEAPARWLAMNAPKAAPLLARLDDRLGNGGLNPVKKWWWDLELTEAGGYAPTRKPVNTRSLSPDLNLTYEDQTLAVYPAPLAPPPYPYPFPMDREAGIEAYQSMVSAKDYRASGGPAHVYASDQGSPVLRVEIAQATVLSPTITKYTLRALDDAQLPEWDAGAHLDIVVAPEYLRQYSMSGNPADRSTYEIGVLREDEGRGGSALLHRIFTPGRKVFISKPINHFPLVEGAPYSLLMGGGIGVTPMIAMAHRLHALGCDFALHYSVSTRAAAAYLDEIAAAPWANHLHLHISDEGTRADLSAICAPHAARWDGAALGPHIYTCGPEAYMAAVMDAARDFPDAAKHLEYFSVPELPEYENHPFTAHLVTSDQTVQVAADEPLSDALLRAGIPVDVKCADGLCGVCQCTVLAGDVEHRDFVLSRAQRTSRIITCQSRAADPNGELKLDL